MEKIATSIVETLSYGLKAFGICFMFSALDSGWEMFVVGLVAFIIGYALGKLELRMENKRGLQKKYYDYNVLHTLGWIFGVISIVGVLVQHGGVYNFALLAMGVYLILAGDRRMKIYYSLRNSETQGDTENTTK